MTKRLITLWLLSATITLLILPALPAGAADTTSAGPAAGGIEVRVPNYAFDPLTQGEPALPATCGPLTQTPACAWSSFLGRPRMPGSPA